MNIDPLAEDYQYNSPYAFAENRVIDGRELEGLEWISSTSSDGKTVNLNLNVKTVNNSGGIISNTQMAMLASDRASFLSSNLGGKDSQDRTVNVSVSYSNIATIVWEYNNSLSGKGVDFEGTAEKDIADILTLALGITDKVGDTQKNRSQINIANPALADINDDGIANFENKEKRAKTAQTGAYEDLHKLGLRHENDKKIIQN